MRLRPLLVLVVLTGLALCAAASGATAPGATPAHLLPLAPDAPRLAPAPAAPDTTARPFARELQRAWRALAEDHQVLGRPVPARPRLAAPAGRRVQLHGWRTRARAAARDLEAAIPHRAQWLCIHGHEGAWDDTGDPYWGGLQMDWGFMRAYGAGYLARKGPASNWTPEEQMMAAERAHAVRGFTPWPNTARICGLL